MANILDYFRQFKFLSLEDLRLLTTMGRLRSFRKGERVSSAGVINYHAIIVVKGLLRAYTITSSGEEITLAFALPGTELASPPSVFKGLPAIDNVEALESSVIFEIDTRKFEQVSDKHFGLTKYNNRILKKTVLMATERIEFYLTLNAEERFDYLQKHVPALIQRVPQKHLASYIGITEVSLSRLKARVAAKSRA